MPEEIEPKPEKIVEGQSKAGLLEKLKIHKFKILGGVLGVLVFTGTVFGAYKLGQKGTQPGPQPTPAPVVVSTPTPQPETQLEDRPSLVVTTDKGKYYPSEIVSITIMSLKDQLEGAMHVERYNEKKRQWQTIEIGTFQVEEQFKDLIKSYGPAASLEKLPKGHSLRVGWIPITQEPVGIEGEGIFQTVALGKNRIMVTVEIGGKEEILYSNEFIIGEEEENPQTNCLGSCKCMKECNKEGPVYFIPVKEGSSECSVNSVNKNCCCSGV